MRSSAKGVPTHKIPSPSVPKGVFVYVGNADAGCGAYLSPEKAREVGGWLIEEAAAWEE